MKRGNQGAGVCLEEFERGLDFEANQIDPITSTGSARFVVVPLLNWPTWCNPQHLRPPAELRAPV